MSAFVKCRHFLDQHIAECSKREGADFVEKKRKARRETLTLQ
jgi:hypothetical protein